MLPPTKRLNYFDHQFLRVGDFTDEQDYLQGMREAHNRMLHTWGVAQGLVLSFEAGESVVTISEGVALDGAGREIVLAADTDTPDLSAHAGKTVYVTLAHGERLIDYTAETGAAGHRRREAAPVVAVSATAPANPDVVLILGRATLDGAGKVSRVDDGEGTLRRRVASAVGGELEARTLTVQGAARAGSLGVEAGIVADTLTATEADVSTLSAGATTVSSLTVRGAAQAASGTVTGVLRVGSLTVDGNADLGGLNVSGASRLGALSAGAATLASLSVTGATTVAGLTASGAIGTAALNVGGTATLGALAVSGNATLSTATVTGLTATNATVTARLGVATASPQAPLHVTGALQISGSGAGQNFYWQSDTQNTANGLRLYQGLGTGGTHVLSVLTDGNVAIGQPVTGGYRLAVFGPTEAVAYFQASGSTSASIRLSTQEGNGNLVALYNRPGGNLVLNTSGAGDAVTVTRAGLMGVGRTPASRLDVAGGQWDLANTEGDFRVGDAAMRLKIGVATTGGGAGDVRIRAQGGTNRLILGGGTADQLAVVSTGGVNHVGINTITPQFPLDVNGVVNATNFFRNGVAFTGSQWADVAGGIRFNGNVGIGVDPFTTLTVNGSLGFPNAATPMMFVYQSGTANADRPIIVHSPGFNEWGLHYRDSDDSFLFRQSTASTTPALTISMGGNVTVGGTMSCQNLTIRSGAKPGYVFDHFVNLAGDPVEQGDVVVIGGSASEYWAVGSNIPIAEVDLASAAYDTRVCGIVDRVVTEEELPFAERREAAEAPAPPPARRGRGKKAAAAAEAPAADEGGHPLRRFAAEAGAREVGPGQMGNMVTLGAYAHCKVDADIAPIAVGDLLTTSPTRGHAQKVLDTAAAVGAIVGKALAPLESGRGKIPVMVLLQ